MALDFFFHQETLTWSGQAGAGLGCAVWGELSGAQMPGTTDSGTREAAPW